MGNIFNIDFQDFIRCLNDAGVEYMLVGGYAVIIHGYNRTTGDLDIWVNRTPENYEKLKKAFDRFRMPVFDMTPERFLYDDTIDVFTFGRPPVSIDIITTLKGVEFNEIRQGVQEVEIEKNLKIKVIHINDLIAAKKASNRPKDQDDIEHLI